MRAKIFYFTMQDEQTKEEKLDWFERTRFENIPFDHITPDQKANWIDLTNNDFDSLLPLIDKDVKAGKSQEAVFQLFSRGVETTRDEWIYDFSRIGLTSKIKFFIESYNKSIDENKANDEIKWSSSLKEYADSKIKISYQESLIIKALYRPYSSQYFYSEKLTSQRLTTTVRTILNRQRWNAGFSIITEANTNGGMRVSASVSKNVRSIVRGYLKSMESLFATIAFRPGLRVGANGAKPVETG